MPAEDRQTPVPRPVLVIYCVIFLGVLGLAFHSYYGLSPSANIARVSFRYPSFTYLILLLAAQFLPVAVVNARRGILTAVSIFAVTAIWLGTYLGLTLALAYVLLIMGIGMVLASGTSLSRVDRLVVALPAGVSAIALVVAILSLIGIARPDVLALVVSALGTPAAISMLWKQRSSVRDLIDRLPLRTSLRQRLLICAIFQFLTVLSFKTRTLVDADSGWYALRTDWNILHDGSMFSDRGLVHFANYYPKLAELVAAPLLAFGEPTFVLLLNVIAVLACLCLIAHMLWRLGVRATSGVFLALCLLSIPAVTWPAQTAKGDILGLYAGLCCAYFLLEYVERKAIAFLAISVTVGFIAVAIRLTFIGYAPALLLAQIAALAMVTRRGASAGLAFRDLGVPLMLILATAITLLRNHHLTGYFLVGIEPIIELQSRLLGMSANSEWRLLGLEISPTADHFPSIPAGTLATSYFLAPHEFTNVWLTWLSFWIPMAALLLALRPRETIGGVTASIRSRGRTGAFVIIGMMLAMLAGGYMFGMRFYGGPADGNYFVFPAIVVAMVLVGLAYGRGTAVLAEAGPIFALHLVAVYFLLSLVLFANYRPISAASIEPFGSPFIFERLMEAERAKFGLKPVQKILAENLGNADCRALASVGNLDLPDSTRNLRPLHSLPCRVEVLELFNMKGYRHFRPIDETAKRFSRYVCDTGLNVIMLRNGTHSLSAEIETGWLAGKDLEKIETEDWTVWLLERHRQVNC